MYSLCVYLFFCVSGTLSFRTDSRFYYTKNVSMFRRSPDEECKVCYYDDCVFINEARCNYNMAIAELVDNPQFDDPQEESDNHFKTEVDNMLFDVIENAAGFTEMECIPLISQYTDCTKENMCLGCRTCTCDEEGTWNCAAHHCRAELKLAVTHQNIQITMGKLLEDDKLEYRKKRSVKNLTYSEDEISITFSDLFEWLHRTKPFNVPVLVNDTKRYSVGKLTSSYGHSIDGLTVNNEGNALTFRNELDPEYVEFDEVLKNIAGDFDHSHHDNKKLDIAPKEQKSYNDEDYMDVVMKAANDAKFTTVPRIKSDVKATESTIKLTEMFIDVPNETRAVANGEGNNKMKNKNQKINPLENMNYNEEINMNVHNIMKRDVTQVLDTNTTEEEKELNNITNVLVELRDNVLYPLNSIVNDKQNEIQELLQVKDSVLDIIKKGKNNNSLDLKTEKTINNDTVISIYRLEMIPDQQLDFRRIQRNYTLLDKLLKILKYDILNAIRNTAKIQKLLNTRQLPKELVVLIRAMKYYIHMQQKTDNKKKNAKNSRRSWSNSSVIKTNTIKEAVLGILSLIDKESSASNILSSLSNKTKILLHRIIKQNVVDELNDLELKIKDNKYNIVGLLNMGSKWQEFIENIAESSPFDRIYNMKLLHLILSVDINKMNDALKMLDFADSRRVNIESGVPQGLLTKINNKLKTINSNLQMIVNIENQKRLTRHNNTIPEINSNKKRSFLKQIKNLLRTSKRELLRLVHKKVPKSEIVKELAKKKLDELTRRKMIEYEDTLLRWQNDLSVITRRRKRTTYEFINNMKRRIKGILPMYLRGKVSPAINAKRKSKNYQRPNIPTKSKVTTKTS